ncbi:MAG: hypothetical protein FJ087_08915 [Deltaproteobacteria bacterium]|nr:hypothetical protein [Deltaproteobacteria bacterium]
MYGELAIDDGLVVLAEDIYQLVSSLQRPRLADTAWAQATRDRCRLLSERVAEAREAARARGRAVSAYLDRMAEDLRHSAGVLSDRPNVARLKEAAKRFADNYEDYVAHLRSQYRAAKLSPSRRLRHVRPVTWRRGIFHASSGVLAVAMYELVLDRVAAVAIMGSLAALAVFLEVSRRAWPCWNAFLVGTVFRGLVRPWERHRMNSATWYVMALTLIALLLPKAAAEVGVVALAFGDPAAALVGSRFGRIRIRGEKSLEGTLAFVLASFGATVLLLALTGAVPGVLALLGLAGSVAIVGAAAELFGDRLDDNFAIPVVAGLVASLWIVL